MPSASKSTTTTTRAKKVAPVAKKDDTPAEAVGRVEGDVFVSEKGQILRQTASGLSLLYSPTPASNPHPFQHSPEEYERLLVETFGALTKIWPLS
jgi:hypothetical protein